MTSKNATQNNVDSILSVVFFGCKEMTKNLKRTKKFKRQKCHFVLPNLENAKLKLRFK